MSAHDVETEILGPMQRIFLPPPRMDEQMQLDALREYSRALESFEAADLHAAWATVRDEHTTQSWPVVGKFVLAARLSVKTRIGLQPRNRGAERNSGAVRWLRWTEARSSELARRALEGDVAWSFKCSILNGAKPHEIDIRELIIGKRNAERTRDAVERRVAIPHQGRILNFSEDSREVALKMWSTLEIREAETQQEIRQHLPAMAPIDIEGLRI